MTRDAPFRFVEAFAGGGMARLGLGPAFDCVLAIDFDPSKAAAYRANFGAEHLIEGDVWGVSGDRAPGRIDLAWASSPCQDLSLAGARAGLSGARSSAFWGFWRLVEALDAEGRAPRSIVIENVTGLLTSSRGEDFRALCAALAERGYRFGAIEADAALWLPQSRARVFVIATREPAGPAEARGPVEPFAGRRVRAAFDALPERLRERWIWWRLAAPAARNLDLAALLEPDAAVPSQAWWSPARTERTLALMSPLQRARLEAIRARGGRAVGAVFRRIRVENGVRVQRAEARFDGLAGCLRTPAGGSSKQSLLIVQDGVIRARSLTPREAARLMGLPEDYRLPEGETRALKLCGDGVAVPVVRALTDQILTPMLSQRLRAAG